jgi:hypothetical protein
VVKKLAAAEVPEQVGRLGKAIGGSRKRFVRGIVTTGPISRYASFRAAPRVGTLRAFFAQFTGILGSGVADLSRPKKNQECA